MRKFTLLFLAIYCLSTTAALAQFNPSSMGNTAPVLELQPSSPQPNSELAVTVTSNDQNLVSAKITWYIDGVEFVTGRNTRTITITTPDSGQKQSIQAVFTTLSGEQVIAKTTVQPVWLDIIIEPQTHVPDFYLGRALPSIGSVINATALISGKGFQNPDLLYRWTLNNKVIGGATLRGKNIINFPMPIGNTAVLALEVSDLSGNTLAKRLVQLPSAQPTLLFYEANPLLGTKQRPATKNFSFIGNTTILKAEPYHLDSQVYNNPNLIEWEIDRVTYGNTGSNPYEITLQNNGTGGRSYLNFHVRDLSQVLQGAKGNLIINL